MVRIFLVWLLCIAHVAFSQNPLLNVYIDTKEVNKVEVPVQAFVKSNGKYYSIFRTEDGTISLPENIEFHKIEALKFTIKSDTIMFTVAKLLEDLKVHPEKNMVDELYAMFKEIKKWELRIDNFKYTSKDQLMVAGKQEQKRTSIYTDYKIYSLRTTSFKYYVVKA